MSKLIINFKNRDLDFTLSGAKTIQGSTLKDLICAVGGGKGIESIELIGQSQSYTFLRQLYLLVNTLVYLNGCLVFLNGKRLPDDRVLAPSYQ